MVLADIPDEALSAAAREFLQSPAEWRPVPGKLRARALELCGQSANIQAADAWQAIIDSDFGRYPVGNAMAIRAMSMCGGFEAFAQSNVEDGDKWRARFIQRYTELLGQQLLVQLPAGVKHARIGASNGR